jgi:hypothetical protein
MNREETYRLAMEVLSGVNRVIETFQPLAPEGEALLTSETRISDDDALFYGRVSSALSLLRACSNRLMTLAHETGLAPKLIEVQASRRGDAARLPTDEDAPRVRERRKPGEVEKWILKRLSKPNVAMNKADLVRAGMAAGISDPALYHQITKLVALGKIIQGADHRLSLNSSSSDDSPAL